MRIAGVLLARGIGILSGRILEMHIGGGMARNIIELIRQGFGCLRMRYIETRHGELGIIRDLRRSRQDFMQFHGFCVGWTGCSWEV